MIEALDTGVRLRPLVPDDVEVLASAVDEGYVVDVDADQIRARLAAQIERGPTLEDDGFLALGIEHEGRLVGDVQARAPRHGFPPGVCEIGVVLLPPARGRGFGRAAVAAFTSYLFDRGWHRVQASTSVDNLAMRRALERAGYDFEGVLRSFMPGESGREDYAMYAAISETGGDIGDGQVPQVD